MGFTTARLVNPIPSWWSYAHCVYYLNAKALDTCAFCPFFKGFLNVDIESAGIPSYEEYVREYCDRMDAPLIDNLDVYMAFNFFRVAAILQGVYKRSLQGVVFYCDLELP